MSDMPNVKNLTQQDYEYLISGIQHHDSILQAKDREIAELKVKAERDWLDKVACMKDAKNVCALTEEVKTLNTRIATLEKQLEGKNYEC